MKSGRIHIRPARHAADVQVFVITCAPHVAIKLRRLFGGIQRTHEAGVFTIAATPGRAYELEWFRQMHPLDIDPGAQKEFRKLVRTERKRLASIARFDEDGYAPPEITAMALPPRDYQRMAADMALTTRNLLLADELGLGKSVSAIAMLVAPGSLPAIIVAQTQLCLQWEAMLKKFAPQLVVHRLRTGQPYEFGKKGELVLDRETGKRRRVTFPEKPDVIITNYHKLDGWAETLAGARAVIFDECQELRHSGTNKYRAAKAVAGQADLRCGLSATPVYNYGGEIFHVMDVIAPDSLGSWSEFTQEWCTGATYVRGDDPNKVKVADPQALGAYLRESGLMLRRTRKEVGRELPALTVVKHVVDCDSAAIDKVAGSVRELAQRILNRLGTPLERMQWSGDIDYQMRQATGIAKAPAIADFVRLLVESGEKVVLFLWHHEVYRIIASNFDRENTTKVSYAMYTGQENEKEKAESLRQFIEGDTQVLMMSLRAGAGVDGIQSVCSTIVIGELDWSPKVHEQNDGRAHRDGQTRPVMSYRLVCDHGSDPVIADVLGIKDAQATGINDPYTDADAMFVGHADDHIRRLAEEILRRTGDAPPSEGTSTQGWQLEAGTFTGGEEARR